MEVQFELTYQLEMKHYVQWYKHVLRNRLYWMGMFIFVGVCNLALGIPSGDWLQILIALFCAMYAVWMYRRPWIVAKRAVKRDLEYYDGENVLSTTTFGDVICDITKDSNMTMHYDKVKDICFSEDLIALTDLKGVSFLMDKNSFTKGDFQSFQVFIREKCPQLKMPNW